MTAGDGAFTETFVEAGGLHIQLRRGGTGAPLLILHGELGVPGWLRAYEQLARHFTVYVPSLPGFGQSARPDWIVSVRDVAAWVTWFVRDLGLSPPLPVIGSSLHTALVPGRNPVGAHPGASGIERSGCGSESEPNDDQSRHDSE